MSNIGRAKVMLTVVCGKMRKQSDFIFWGLCLKSISNVEALPALPLTAARYGIYRAPYV